MIKATLVLEGGANRGVFTSGALDYLMEEDIYFSHVIGVSAGSCNAVDYVSKQIKRTKDCMIHSEKEYDYYMSFGRFVKEKSMLNMDMIFDKYPNELFPFDYDTFFRSQMECEIVVTNCETGKAEYQTEKADKERLMRLCRASSSMPLVTPAVNIDGTAYLDGGLADSVPVKRAFEKENEKIIVILTRNAGYRKQPSSKGSVNVYRNAYKKYPNLVETIRRRYLTYNRTMELIEKLEKEGRIFVLRPEIKPVSRMERNVDTLTAFYRHGYELMKRETGHLLGYLEK